MKRTYDLSLAVRKGPHQYDMPEVYDIRTGVTLFKMTYEAFQLLDVERLAHITVDALNYNVEFNERTRKVRQTSYPISSLGREDIADLEGVSKRRADQLDDGDLSYLARELGESLSEDYAISLPIVVEYRAPEVLLRGM